MLKVKEGTATKPPQDTEPLHQWISRNNGKDFDISGRRFAVTGSDLLGL
jgi:hypothetical protein